MTYALNPPLRVLLVCHELSLTGAPRLALGILAALGPAIEVRTISEEGGPLEGAFRKLGPVSVLRRLPGGAARWGQPARTPAAKALGRVRAPLAAASIRTWRPDVVYVNSTAAARIVPRLGVARIPKVLHVHELTVAIARLEPRHRGLLATLPNRYIAVSGAVRDELVQRQGVDAARVRVIPPMVDIDRILELAGPRPDSANGDPRLVVGGAGNPHWTKGVELWLLMARAVLDELGPERIAFEWVGVRDNAAGVEFRAMVRKLGLTDSVTLVPETPNPYGRFARFDVFAMTSWEEAASLVVLEAMALGVPVVCFAGSGGPAEEVGDAGVVIGQFSPTLMGQAVAGLAGDPARRSELATRGRARAEDFRPERIAGLVLDALRSAL